MDLRRIGYVIVLALVCQGVLRAETTDERIRKLEELVKNQAETNKAQATRIEALEKKQTKSSVDQQVDKALARSAAATVLASSRPDVKGTGLIASAEFLYMQPVNGSFQWAGIGTGDFSAVFPTISVVGEAKMRDLEYNWGPGFRAGLGYRLPHDGWDIAANFTSFNVGAEDSIAVPEMEEQLAAGIPPVKVVLPGPLWGDLPINAGTLIGPIFGGLFSGSTIIPYENARAEADLNLRMLDLDISRRFKVSESLDARIFAGPRLMWLNQEFKATFASDDDLFPATFTSVMRSEIDFFGAGIRLGAEGDMALGKGISLVGKVAGSLLHGTFEHRCSETDTYSDPSPITFRLTASGKTEYNRVLPIAEGSLGFAWEKKINEGLNFRVQAAYEFMTVFNTPYTIIFRKNDNLAFHGLALRFKFDF